MTDSMQETGGSGAGPRALHPWVTAGKDRIRFGVGQISPLDDWPAYLEVVRVAEELGFDSYWTYDHPSRGAECWTSLAAAAMATTKIRVGTIPSCIFYRSPVVLARAAADVDRISNGRLVLGLGIGDDAPECAAMGLVFPGVRERLQAMDETVQIVQGVWGEQPFTLQGEQFQVAGVRVAPGPMQRPHVPLMICGGGERVTLRQVAQYGDVSNFAAHAWAGGAFTLDDVRRKYDALRRHCDAAGRPYESILRTYLDIPVVLAKTHSAVQAKLDAIPMGVRTHFQSSTLAATPDEAISHFRDLATAGVQYFVVALYGHDTETVRLLGQEVLPRLAGTPHEVESKRGRLWFMRTARRVSA
jgi:alkanesulfonate monooxygenase SsuD/methylene tetrahydromethanopterin reductase-like flavin-dependent oxidoreductase (luciferase family)